MNLSIVLTIEELDYIGQLLVEEPYKNSAELIHNIQNQVREHQQLKNEVDEK